MEDLNNEDLEGVKEWKKTQDYIEMPQDKSAKPLNESPKESSKPQEMSTFYE